MRSKMIALFLTLGVAASIIACGSETKTETGEDGIKKIEETVDTEASKVKDAETQLGQDIKEEVEDIEEKAN